MQISCVKSSRAFDEQLLSHIRSSRNEEVKSMITRDLANASDDFGTLLHYTAMHGNTTIIRHLIELNGEIDSPGRDGQTPLMIALLAGRTAAMKMLLNADADIESADHNGQSALQFALNRDYVSCHIVEPFARKLQRKTRTTAELAERLIAAGGNMYHAATLGDVKLMECMLDRGIDVDCKGANGATGLHAAAELEHQQVASWLITNGADVNALDNRGNSALHVSAKNRSKRVTMILLEHGANCDRTSCRDSWTRTKLKSGEQFAKCPGSIRREVKGVHTVPVHLDEHVLSLIKLGFRVPRSKLNENSVKAFDDEGTFLHHAARHGNAKAARQLIELASNVDFFARGQTPLMLAVRFGNAATVRVLLEAKANIDVAQADGQSALQMALVGANPDFGIVQAVIRELQRRTCTTEKLADKLISAGGKMHNVVALQDVDLMRCILERGMNIDSKCFWKRTALHRAAEMNDLNLANWLVSNGANVNALDRVAISPLLLSALNGNKDMMKMLLERGADPNERGLDASTPLFALFESAKRSADEELVECVELLILFGAVPRNSTLVPRRTMFDHALKYSCNAAIKILICHLAMLEILEEGITKPVMFCQIDGNRSKMPELWNFHEQCMKVLMMPVFGKLTLFNLLQMNEFEVRVLVRKEIFVCKVEKFCTEKKLSELYAFYNKRLMDSIAKANRFIKLEDEAIAVVCKLFGDNYNESHIFARKVIGYLNIPDLKNLIQV